jgi:hypothetical protein
MALLSRSGDKVGYDAPFQETYGCKLFLKVG